jgi:imidazolonepropionase
MALLIRNIRSLVQVREETALPVKGGDMAVLPAVEDAFLLLEGEHIAAYGRMEELEEGQYAGAEIIDASGKLVFPGWCDPHTHLVYAGSREGEFVDRIHGLSYEEIARRGGGILNSARRLHLASEEDLVGSALKRLEEIMRMGTGAVEIKSGYGLTVDDELKMLRVIRKLKSLSPLTIKATFLGAHALPLEYRENREGYVRLVVEEMIPRVAEEGLAEFCDVFCDKGFFTPEETDRILEAGLRHGLKPKIHANELDYSGGIQVGVKHGALSVDHLEYTGDEEIEVLLRSQTMPTLLPSTAFFLRIPYPPARKMMEAGLPLALATDYNPGSSPSGKMAFILSLACIQMRMTPEEAINAATINAAFAMGLEATHGSITRGKQANVFITREIPSATFLPYSFGSELAETVIIKGKIR